MPLLQIIIFSLPLYLVRFSVFGFNANALDVLLILFILWQFINYRSGIRLLRSARNDSVYFLPISLILIGAIIATANSSDILRSLGILKSYFILPILFFFTSSSIIKTEEQKKKILSAWLYGGFTVALISVFYWLAGDLTYDGRLRAFFDSPNQLAMFLAPTFIVGTYLVAPKKMMLMATIGIIIFATKSLGAITAISISLICFFIFRRYFVSLHLGASMRTKIGVIILLIFLFSSFCFLFSTKDFSERSSLSSRVTIWQSAGTILKDNWVLGIGPGTFQEKYLEYQKYFPPYLEWASPQPHNIFLAFWLQTGIIGLIGFLWLIFIFFKNVWQNKKDGIVFLSGVLMIYTLAHGIIDTTYWRNDLAIMFWMIILLSLNLAPTKSSARQD